MRAGESGDLIEADGFLYRRAGPQSSQNLIVALHGSGADEETMLPLARAILPMARFVAPRGRIDQNGERRWFRKVTPTSFEQDSIRAEAEAFAQFLDGLAAHERFDPASTLFLGYSNGGNLVHSTILLHPGRIRRAAVALHAGAEPRAANRFDGIAGHRARRRRRPDYGPHVARLVALVAAAGRRRRSLNRQGRTYLRVTRTPRRFAIGSPPAIQFD